MNDLYDLLSKYVNKEIDKKTFEEKIEKYKIDINNVIKNEIEVLKKNNKEEVIAQNLKTVIGDNSQEIIEAVYNVLDMLNASTCIEIGQVLLKAKNLEYKKLVSKCVMQYEKFINEIIQSIELPLNSINNISYNFLLNTLKNLYIAFNKKEYDELESFKSSKDFEKVGLFFQSNNAKNSAEKASLTLKINIIEKEILELNNKFYSKIIGYADLKEMFSNVNKDVLFSDSNYSFNFAEFKKYIDRLVKYGEYKTQENKQKAFTKILGKESIKEIAEVKEEVYHGETAPIPSRSYMINDSSKFKTSLYKFLMDDITYFKDDLDLNKVKKGPIKEDDRAIYVYEKTGTFIGALTMDHIALLISLENVFMTCEEYVDDEGKLFLRKVDLMKLFGENFRGNRENVFLDLVRDMSQTIIQVGIYNASQVLEGKNKGEITSEKIGKIEGNLMSFKVMTNREGDYIYKIEMPFLKELLKRSTRNTLKSIELIKYTFQQPKNILIAEYISNVLFYHCKYNNTHKFIRLRTFLEKVGMYEKFKNMERRSCNRDLLRLKENIELACMKIRNVEKVEFTKMSKTQIDKADCGFTIFINKEVKKIG